ncbi:hypothetical protein N431DRAFT_493812 [Stipitochalara longipes BDJ]|nr:hypothetical protein N431DRAFT_493812 [Stipitochalara longipes BDJ]
MADASSVQPCCLVENWHWRYRWADPDLEPLITWCETKLPWNLYSNRTEKHQKVIVNEAEKIVGYARWLLLAKLAEMTGDEVVWKEVQTPEPTMENARKWEDQWVIDPPKIRSDEMLAYRAQGCEAAEQRITDGDQNTVYCGLDIADRYQQKSYLIGTSEGAKLYETITLSVWWIGPYVNHFMVRDLVSKNY